MSIVTLMTLYLLLLRASEFTFPTEGMLSRFYLLVALSCSTPGKLESYICRDLQNKSNISFLSHYSKGIDSVKYSMKVFQAVLSFIGDITGTSMHSHVALRLYCTFVQEGFFFCSRFRCSSTSSYCFKYLCTYNGRLVLITLDSYR